MAQEGTRGTASVMGGWWVDRSKYGSPKCFLRDRHIVCPCYTCALLPSSSELLWKGGTAGLADYLNTNPIEVLCL